ncbi:DUF664 domain-containing protein [Streptomyces sp. NPDC015345]|uniref:mycothiol transferase n=1 Tax=Streptomyces sp. NPDC015345 TaxID=3364953 RepID=UPI0036FA581B
MGARQSLRRREKRGRQKRCSGSSGTPPTWSATGCSVSTSGTGRRRSGPPRVTPPRPSSPPAGRPTPRRTNRSRPGTTSEQRAPVRPDTADKPPSRRWTLTHLIEETARHAGHADVLRELADGTAGR